MNFWIFVMVSVLLIALVAFVRSRLIRREKRAQQVRIDQDIENALFRYMTEERAALQKLTKHSEPKRIAKLVAARVLEYIEMGVHPDKLIRIFSNLQLENVDMKEVEAELANSIKYYISSEINTRKLNVYMYTVCEDHARGFKELEKTFLARTKKDGFVMNLSLN